jgi:hypothetical protein
LRVRGGDDIVDHRKIRVIHFVTLRSEGAVMASTVSN